MTGGVADTVGPSGSVWLGLLPASSRASGQEMCFSRGCMRVQVYGNESSSAYISHPGHFATLPPLVAGARSNALEQCVSHVGRCQRTACVYPLTENSEIQPTAGDTLRPNCPSGGSLSTGRSHTSRRCKDIQGHGRQHVCAEERHRQELLEETEQAEGELVCST